MTTFFSLFLSVPTPWWLLPVRQENGYVQGGREFCDARRFLTVPSSAWLSPVRQENVNVYGGGCATMPGVPLPPRRPERMTVKENHRAPLHL